jgi:hypothetical protein
LAVRAYSSEELDHGHYPDPECDCLGCTPAHEQKEEAMPGNRAVDMMVNTWMEQQEKEGLLVRIPFPCKDCGSNCGQCGTRFPAGYSLVSKEIVEELEKKFPEGFNMSHVEQYRIFLERYKGKNDRLEKEHKLKMLDTRDCDYHQSKPVALGPYRSSGKPIEVRVERSRWARFRSRFKHVVWALLVTIRGGFLTRWKFKCVYCQKRSKKLLHVWSYMGPHADDEEWFDICPKCRKVWEPSHHPLKSLRNGTR